jgi:hypothetical protein
MIIEADLGVSEILVVDQDQVGAGLAGQFRHHRARPRHVGLDALPADQVGLDPRTPRNPRTPRSPVV